ncbi:hypothetical protein DO97_15920 [Neosynechococcus sphagnicola sy1]|uniref:Uncharacterized protein n=1 Tax=Neosynechococcus sphagnicola sy1 TaxID=1497020 RepID=A0A098TIA5_9CYAN|nr:hypothetical protein [Neosynechococcus sphagnicola]KGF71761.1 hypothetical protein DO97_15920 [Neosynechococcus sphagnicola sy1]
MIRLLKNLVGGIFAFLSGLFKPKSKYFMEYQGSSPSSAKSVDQDSSQKVEKVVKPAPVEMPSAAPVAKPPAAAAPLAATAKTLNLPAPTVSFAPTYLNPIESSNGGRRSPGANMTSFLDMASKLNASK